MISSALGILSLYGNHAVVMGRTFYVLAFLLTVELANESIMQIYVGKMLSVRPHQTKNSLSSLHIHQADWVGINTFKNCKI